ncbi:MAG: ribose-5-phosphate isomerase RpiA [Candidatus Thermoplasmatota archaeon]
MEKEELKQLAGEKAVEQIEEGMILGLGTGSTVKYSILKIAEMIKEKNLDVKGIPTSMSTKRLAKKEGIPLTDLKENPEIDLTIDGADEVDSNLNLIKGGGGALLREKIVAYHSKKEIIVVDDSKVTKALGLNFAIPVEVAKFGWTATKKALEELECEAELRTIMDEVYITDNGNYIIDCDFGRIREVEELEEEINSIPGVVENGLFVDLADVAIVGGKQGITTLTK